MRCKILSLDCPSYSGGEKGDRSNLCDDQRCTSVPAFGPFRQIGPVPFFLLFRARDGFVQQLGQIAQTAKILNQSRMGKNSYSFYIVVELLCGQCVNHR
jgi:hypothetical protein